MIIMLRMPVRPKQSPENHRARAKKTPAGVRGLLQGGGTLT